MKIYKPLIVVIAYNRPRSLSRLLNSLEKGNYPSSDIPLLISIDRAKNNTKVLRLANEFEWKHGKKTVKYQDKNLGLRTHVLKCGDLTQEFGSIIMLEDDLYVSPDFYNFTVNALNFSKADDNIAGVSLYNHQYNVHTLENFSPIEDGYSNWFFQFASSWGQAWTFEQWKSFKKWYAQNPKIDKEENIPLNVRSWSEKSWLKYFIAYLIESNKFFLYPKISLTTNFSDAGTHVGEDSTSYQVPLLYGKNSEYIFSNLEDSISVYDAFYENLNLSEYLDVNGNNLCIDLYGYKTVNKNSKRFLLTTKRLDNKIIQSFGMSLKPRDTNVINQIEGNEINLYDLDDYAKNNNNNNRIRKLTYNLKNVGWLEAYFILKHHLIAKFKRIIKIS